MENDLNAKLEKMLELLVTIEKKLDDIQIDISMVNNRIDRMD